MKTKSKTYTSPPLLLHRSEDGYALILSLVFLVLLTILGMGSSTSTMYEVQISGNDRSRKSAFYAAEAGRSYVESSADLYNSTNIISEPGNGIKFPNDTDPDEWVSLVGSPSEQMQGEVVYTGAANRYLRGSGNEAGTIKAHVYRITSHGRDTRNDAQKSIEAGFFRLGL